MPDWTAITGIVVSGVVGPSVGAGFALWRQRVDHDTTRRRDDLVEARALLDAASQDLRRARETSRALTFTYVELGGLSAERPKQTIEAFRRLGRDLDLADERLALRFGDSHPLVEAHSQATRGLHAVGEALGIVGTDRQMPPELLGRLGAETGLSDLDGGCRKFRQAAAQISSLRLPS